MNANDPLWVAIDTIEKHPENYTETEKQAAWQFLIDSGHAWTLQGWYGRQAESLIEQGLCTPAHNPSNN